MTTDTVFIPADKSKLSSLSGIDTVVYDTAGSTNSELLSTIRSGDASPRIYVAKKQTSGRGRLGRSFASDSGGVYFSFNLSLPTSEAYKTGLITPLAGVAAATALSGLYGIDVKLKWVNDLLFHNKKLGGILSESVIIGDKLHVVVGIGINVANGELPDVATSLSEHTSIICDANELIAQITHEFFSRLPDIDNIANEYRTMLCHLGMRVRVHTFDGSADYVVLATDVTDDCRLTVKTDSGEERILSSGEVSVRF